MPKPKTQAILDPDTARTDILAAIKPSGECEVAIACQFGFDTQDVRRILKELEKEGLVQFDDYQKLWFLYPTKQRLEDLKAEIRRITEKVRLAFYEIGVRLAEIADKKLYELDGYVDFKEFIARELGFTRDYAYKQIAAAQVFDELGSEYTKSIHGCIRETHLRPLTKEDLTSGDRQSIWEGVQSELVNLETSGKSAKLTAKLVEKHVMEFRESQVTNPPALEPLQAGDYCKVRLRSGHLDALSRWDDKVVRVRHRGELGSYICSGCFGEEIGDHFFREELFVLADTAVAKFSVELSVGQLKELPRTGSIENAVSTLLGHSNIIEFPQKANEQPSGQNLHT